MGCRLRLLTSDDQLIGSVHCYRDSRTDGVLESVTAQVGRERIYSTTGIQFLFLILFTNWLARLELPSMFRRQNSYYFLIC